MQKRFLQAAALCCAAALFLAGCPATEDPSKSSDATLKSLTVSAGNEALSLSPAFAPETTAYAVAAGNEATSITVTAEANHRGATVRGGGGHSLDVGSNSITITVTAEDGSPGEYTLTATRAGTAAESVAVDALDLTGLVTAPVKDIAPDTDAINRPQYTGIVAWQTADGTLFTGAAFAPDTAYRAALSLTAKEGYTFAGVEADSFAYTGAASVSNAAGGGTAITVVIVFPATEAGADTTPPGPVSDLLAESGIGSATLSWLDPGDADLDHIAITVSPAPAGLSQPVTVGKGIGTATIGGLVAGTVYTFALETVDAAGNRGAGGVINRAPRNPELEWTLASQSIYTGSTDWVMAIAWNGSRFVAGGRGGKMAWSEDGETWTAIPAGTEDGTTGAFGRDIIYAIAWGGAAGEEKFVAVGGSGRIAWSVDGECWTAVTVTGSPFGIDNNNTLRGVAWNGSRFVAVGYVDSKTAWSVDGITWTPGPVYPQYAFSGRGITWGGPPGQEQFVAVGGAANLLCSPDGETWTPIQFQDVLGPNTINCIVWNGSRFVAGCANGGQMAWSDDGTTWTAVTDSPFAYSVNSIAWNGSRFVAVGYRGQTAWSADGETWTAATGDTFGTKDLYSVCYGAGKFVAGGAGLLAWSGDQE